MAERLEALVRSFGELESDMAGENENAELRINGAKTKR
jgi:hypothetical protein